MVWGKDLRITLRASIGFYCLLQAIFFNATSSYAVPLECAELVNADHDLRSVKARLIASEINLTRVLYQLKRITGEVPLLLEYKTPDRHTGAHRELIRLYLTHYLRALGYSVQFERFKEGMNLIVEIPGVENPEEVFEVTAHYDTVARDVPGADDNGSGVVTLLELANIFKRHRPKKTLRLVFMDLEEDDFQGSAHHAEKLREEFFSKEAQAAEKKRRFLGSLVIDTIAFNPRGQDHLVVLEVGTAGDYGRGWGTTTGGEAAHAITLLCAKDMCHQFARFADETHKRNYTSGEKSALRLQIDAATAKPSTADHGSYWKEELPALLLAAPYKKPYINPGYHKPTDTIPNLNWDYFARVMQFAIESVALITEAEPKFSDTPQNREILAHILASENITITRQLDLIKKLEAIREPQKKSRPLREVHSEALLVFESNSSKGDIIDTDGQDTYISSSSELKEISREAFSNHRPVVRKKRSGFVSRAEADLLALWLIDYLGKPTSERPKLPEGFELVEKPHEPETRERSWWNF